MSRLLVYLLYNLLLPLLLAAGFPRFVLKGLQRGGLARHFGQRLGLYRPGTRARLDREGNVWIHAVSVGEVLVAVKLVEEILRQRPGTPVVLSTTTTTGFAVAAERTAAWDPVTVIHNPVDLPWITAAALRRIRPERLILVEAEVWPNLVRQARARGIPVALVNARLSDRSERRFRACGALTRPVFSLLDRVGVPYEGDLARWAGLGVAPERIAVTGSVKFDETLQDRPEEAIAGLREWLAAACGIPAGARLLLAGSTHPGEEALIGRVWTELRPAFPDLALVVVPRHAERAAAVAADLRGLGLRPVLKVPPAGTADGVGGNGAEGGGDDGNADRGPAPAGAAEGAGPVVGVANTTGELRAWFHLADAVVIGKSLLGHGGQNPVEPLAAGCPVVVGPNMENFRAIVADLLERGGLVQIEGPETLRAALAALLADPAGAAAMVRRGREALDRHRGAARRTVAWLWSAPEPDAPGPG